MPNDATFELLADLQNKQKAAIALVAAPIYNIDDMDPKFCMINLMFSGCYCLVSTKTIDPERPGMIYIDGTATEPPLTPAKMPMFGQIIGIHCRKYLHEYDCEYQIRYVGAYDTNGLEVPEFSFTLKTLPRTEPGEKYPAHDAIVLQAAREGAVLLKNDNGALPLGKGAAVNVFGKGAVVFHTGCLGAGKINPRYSIRVKEGIEKYTTLQLNEELYRFYMSESNELPGQDALNRAKAMSDTAVVFIERNSSEAHDGLAAKGHYYLTDGERAMLAGVRNTFEKIVAVLNVAYPIETAWIEEYGVDAVLLTGISGMAGGRALAEILEGSVNPSGKLANTWAKDYWDYPSAKNFLTLPDVRAKYEGQDIKYVTTVYEEGLYVGYRYFDTFQKEAAFLFGHGLSYTTFERKLRRTEVNGLSAKVEMVITNTGNVSGKDVVALYARIPDGKLEQPDKRLVAFAKTEELAPRESQILTLEICENRLKSFDEETASWIIEAGEIELLAGNTPADAERVCTICVPETVVLRKAQSRIPCPVEIRELSKTDPQGTYPTGVHTKGFTGEKLPFAVSRKDVAQETPLQHAPKRLITFPEVVCDPALAESFVAQMTDYELARFSVGGRTGWGAEDSGFAGMIFNGRELEKYQIPDYYFADGNNGCNMVQPNIGFPVSTTMCATWNEALSFAEGVAIATEARDMNLHCLLAPALNLQRNPLCGRHTEYFSEDPFLAGRMAGQESRGFEAVGVSSCMKHFFANNAETMRNMNHSIMTERIGRELYIGAFEVAFEVNKPDTVMTGYNAANGVYCADDHSLLRGILREELGFEGFVMTDWNGYGNQGMEGALDAGISFLAPGSEDDTLVEPIVNALQSGKLSRARLQNNILDMVRILIRRYLYGR